MSTKRLYILIATLVALVPAIFSHVHAASQPLLVKDITTGSGSTELSCSYNQVCSIYNNTIKVVYTSSVAPYNVNLLQTAGTAATTTNQVLESGAMTMSQFKLDESTVIINTLPNGQNNLAAYGIVNKFSAVTNQYTTLFSNGMVVGVTNGKVYVISLNEQTQIRTLYVVDATTGTSTKLQDFAQDYAVVQFNTLNNGTVIFVVYDDAGFASIWKTDNTLLGTVKIDAIVTGDLFVNSIITLGTSDLVSLSPGPGGGATEIWRTDGTEQGSYKLIQNYNFDGQYNWESGAPIEQLLTKDGFSYFPVVTPDYQYGIMKTDGTVQGTSIATTIGSPNVDFVYPLGVANNRLYLVKYTGFSSTTLTFASSELVQFDGTTLSTVKSQLTGTNTDLPYMMIPYISGEKLFISVLEMHIQPQSINSTDPKAVFKQLLSNDYVKNLAKQSYKTVGTSEYKATSYLFKVDTTANTVETFVFRETTDYVINPIINVLGMLPNEQLMVAYTESQTLGRELYKVIPVPTSLQNFYYTFGRWKYNTKLTNAQLRTGDMAYLKNYNSSQLRIMQVYLYDYVKKGNQPMSWTWKSGSTAYVKTTANLPTGRQYAFVMKMQDKATGYIVSKYFVFRL